MPLSQELSGPLLADDLALRPALQDSLEEEDMNLEAGRLGLGGDLQLEQDLKPYERRGLEVLPAQLPTFSPWGVKPVRRTEPLQLNSDMLPLLAYFDDPALLDEENGLYGEISNPELAVQKRREAVVSRFLADHFGLPEEEAKEGYDFLARQYAREELELKGPMDAAALFEPLKLQVENEAADEKDAEAAMNGGFEAAVKGQDSLAALGSYQKESDGLHMNTRTRHAAAFMDGYAAADALLNPLRVQLQQTVDARGRIMNSQPQPGDQEMAEALLAKMTEMPDEQTQVVLAALNHLAEEAGQQTVEAKGFVTQAGEAIFRTADGMLSDNAGREMDNSLVPSTGKVRWSAPITNLAEAREYVREKAMKNMSSRLAAASGDGYGTGISWETGTEIHLTPEMTVLIDEAKRLAQKRIDLDRSWTQLSQKMDPVTNRWASTLGTGAAIGGLVAFTKGMALPALGMGYANAEYERLRYEHPEMDRGDAGLLAVGHGAINMVLDRVAPGILSKTPALRTVLRSSTASIMARRLAGRAVAQGGIETGIGTVQTYTTPVLQTLLSAVKKDVPDYEWENDPGFLQNYRENLPFTLALTMVFTGRASLRDYRDVGNVRKFNNELGAMGILERDRTRIHEALRNRKFDDADALMKAASRRLDPSIADFYQQRLLAQQERDVQAVQERMREARVELQQHEGLWIVRTPQGQAYFTDPEAALQGVDRHMARQEMTRDEGTMQVFQQFARSSAPGQSFAVNEGTINLAALAEQARVRGDKATLESVWNRLEIERARRNEPELDLSDLNVLGRSSYSFKENVAVSASELYRNGRAIDLVEEKSETDAFRFMSRSPQSRASLRSAILQVEQVTGDKYLFNETDLGLAEAYSALVRLYVTGSRPGNRNTVSEAVRNQEAARFREERARLRQAYESGEAPLVGVLRENMEFFRQTQWQAARLRQAQMEGRLGDADQFIQETLGLAKAADGDAFTAPATPYMEWAPAAPGGLHHAQGMSLEPVVRNLGDAETYLRSLSGSPLTTADGITATLSNQTAAKMVSGSAVKKSSSYKAHLFAIQNFQPLFAAGEIRQTYRDRANDPNIAAIHRVYSDFDFEGQPLSAKFTVKELIHPAGNRIYSIEAVELEGAPPAGLLINGGSGEPRTIPLTGGAMENNAPVGLLQGQSAAGTEAGPAARLPTDTSPMQGFSLEPAAGGSQPLWQGISGHAKDGQAKTIAILGRTEQGTYRMRIPGGREQEMSEATVASMTGFSAEQLRGLPDSAAAFSETPSVTRKAEQAAQAKAAQPAVDAQREAFTRRLGQPYGRLTEEQGKMEAAFIEMISSDVAGAVNQYVDRFGNRVDADNARRLYPSFDSSRESRQALTPVTGRPANALAQVVYQSLLENPALVRRTGADPDGPVLFLAGGAGSGKSSSIDPADAKDYSIIVDSVLGNKKRAISQIDMAVAKGRKVRIQYVHQPLDKAVDNAIQRALDPKDGRIVPAHAVANTHLNAQKALFELRDHYAENPNVSIKIVDHDNFASRPITLQELAGKSYTHSAEELAQQARDHARKALQRRAGEEGLTPEMVEQILAAP